MNQPPDPQTAPAPTCYRHPGRETWISCQRCGRPICPDCMTTAAVGFQCPDCVADGRRTTRQVQASYGGRRSDNPALTSLVIIGINVAVWAAVSVTGGRSSRLLDWITLRRDGVCTSASDPSSYYPYADSAAACAHPQLAGDGLWMPAAADGAWWQVLTSAFAHVDVWHIGLNMLALWFLGPQIESLLGRARFIALYFAAALGGSAAVLWFAGGGATLGASGAIWGLLGSLLILAWKRGADLRQLLMWLGINLVMTFAFPGISWQAHLGGLAAGTLVTALVAFAPRQQRSLVQWGGIAATYAVILALIVVRLLQYA